MFGKQSKHKFGDTSVYHLCRPDVDLSFVHFLHHKNSRDVPHSENMLQLNMTTGDVFIHSAVIKNFQLYTQHSTDLDTATCLLDTYLNGAHNFESPAIN